jgi:hypothetical protein
MIVHASKREALTFLRLGRALKTSEGRMLGPGLSLGDSVGNIFADLRLLLALGTSLDMKEGKREG